MAEWYRLGVCHLVRCRAGRRGWAGMQDNNWWGNRKAGSWGGNPGADNLAGHNPEAGNHAADRAEADTIAVGRAEAGKVVVGRLADNKIEDGKRLDNRSWESRPADCMAGSGVDNVLQRKVGNLARWTAGSAGQQLADSWDLAHRPDSSGAGSWDNSRFAALLRRQTTRHSSHLLRGFPIWAV